MWEKEMEGSKIVYFFAFTSLWSGAWLSTGAGIA
jgi:hypothetical protein